MLGLGFPLAEQTSCRLSPSLNSITPEGLRLTEGRSWITNEAVRDSDLKKKTFSKKAKICSF